MNLAAMCKTSKLAYAAIVTNAFAALVFAASAWAWAVGGDAAWGRNAFVLAALTCGAGVVAAATAKHAVAWVPLLAIVPPYLAGQIETRVTRHLQIARLLPSGTFGTLVVGTAIGAFTIASFFSLRVTAAARAESRRRRLHCRMATSST